MIADYSIKDWIMYFWDISYRTGGLHLPMNGSLWFIRDLMVAMVLSPLIWLTVKYLKYWGVIILMLAWLSVWSGPFTGLSTGAVFFFATGAWFGINKIEFVRKIKPVYILTFGGGVYFGCDDSQGCQGKYNMVGICQQSANTRWLCPDDSSDRIFYNEGAMET